MLNTKIIIAIVVLVAGSAGIVFYQYSVQSHTSVKENVSAETSIKIKQATPADNVNKDFFKNSSEYTKVKPKTLEELGLKELGK